MSMNSNNKGLENLKEALREINKWEYENLHLEDLEDVTPSSQYTKRMERLIKRQKRPYWKYVNTVGKRVAVIAVALTLAFTLSMSVSAVREPVVEFFVNIYEKFVEFFYDEEDIAMAPDTIETVYTLGYVPEGYELESCEVKDLATQLVWMNAENKSQIVLIQRVLDGHNQFDNETVVNEIIDINGSSIYFVEKNEMNLYFWNNQEYKFTLKLTDNISRESAMILIESIIEFAN